MGRALALADRVSGLSRTIGRAVAWLLVPLVLVSLAVVGLRYGFGVGRVWLQESVLWMHATLFMVGAGWALERDAHVRIDIAYEGRSPRWKAAVDLGGVLLLLAPFCIVILVMGWPYVRSAWRLREVSRESGGLPGVFLLKTLILAYPALLLLQGAAMAVRASAVLLGTPRSPPELLATEP